MLIDIAIAEEIQELQRIALVTEHSQNPAEDLFGLSASLLASLCSDSSLRSCYFGHGCQDIFKEYGFMWGTKAQGSPLLGFGTN